MTIFRDLSQHILDIAENGVKAGATLLHVTIEEDTAADTLRIVVQDNGWGMNAETLAKVEDPWYTTRTTRNVGLGIPFFKQAAEMCNGTFDITSEPGVGTTTAATFQHSHIDRPPLGDLAGTLLCMIVGFEGVDVLYEHRVDDRTFTLDTRDIRAVLGDDVPFSDPEVLAFLNESLHEGWASLQGETGMGNQ
ncbi:MAG TPA: ATP-binding protein [Anaerolineae bacterium]|nr:ATP-binding protein [Anaerolineae bacterium]HQI87738.1 ATP-binding protein [Anaerolineae bacterium]